MNESDGNPIPFNTRIYTPEGQPDFSVTRGSNGSVTFESAGQFVSIPRASVQLVIQLLTVGA